MVGICSAPVVEGDRLWYVTNRGEVVCLDTEGFRDDQDDGPVTGVLNRLFDMALNPAREADADLLQGLEHDRIAPLLHKALQDRGIDPIQITTEVPRKNWTVTGTTAGGSTELRLTVTDHWLTCNQKITAALKTEADVVWTVDMMQQLGARQHNMATCAPTIWGDYLFICTSNGVDESHLQIPAPDAPSFLALDKRTGKVLWSDKSPGDNIMHGQWSCPAVGVFDGVPQVIFPGGDGWIYSFRADAHQGGRPELLWKFDGNRKDAIYLIGGRTTRLGIIAVPVIYDGRVYVAMGEDPEHGEGPGCLWCIDPTKRGDVSPELVVDADGKVLPHQRIQASKRVGNIQPQVIPNPNSAVVWRYEQFDQDGNGKIEFEEQMHRTLGSPTIKNDLLFITDFSGLVHCVNAKTGKPWWTCDMLAACWSTPLIVGEKAYIADEDGDVAMFSLSPDPSQSVNNPKDARTGVVHEPLLEINMGESINTMPVVANNVLYIATKNRLFAIATRVRE